MASFPHCKVSSISIIFSNFMPSYQTNLTHKNCNLNFSEFIPMSELTLGAVLGEGEFGSVLRATYSPADQAPQPVAVKTLHMQHTDTNKKEFLSEAKVMMSVRHRCIVRLIGVSLVSCSTYITTISLYLC